MCMPDERILVDTDGPSEFVSSAIVFSLFSLQNGKMENYPGSHDNFTGKFITLSLNGQNTSMLKISSLH